MFYCESLGIHLSISLIAGVQSPRGTKYFHLPRGYLNLSSLAKSMSTDNENFATHLDEEEFIEQASYQNSSEDTQV